MKTRLMLLTGCLCMGIGTVHAAEPNCTPQEEGVKVAQAAAKAKPDLSKCKELEGKEKGKCEKEVREQVKKTLAAANKALACCRDPQSCK